MIDYRYVEAFLTVVNTGSVSKAADALYVSQSSISKWLNLLEEELGTKLILRHRGQRTVELTASGKELLPLAEDWLTLHHQILEMKETAQPSIRIAAIDSLNSFVLPELYRHLLRTIPQLRLSISTDQSVAIYSMVEKKRCDVGIVTLDLHSPNLHIVPFMEEPFQLLMYSSEPMDEHTAVPPQSLDIRKNLFIPCGYLYSQWHEYWWHSVPSYLWVDPVATAEKLFSEEGLWTIVPNSIAQQIMRNPNVHCLPLESSPPSRTTYLITHKYPRSSCKAVLKQTMEFLQSMAEHGPFDASDPKISTF